MYSIVITNPKKSVSTPGRIIAAVFSVSVLRFRRRCVGREMVGVKKMFMGVLKITG